MTECTELWVDRGQLRKTKVVTGSTGPLAAGEVRVAVDKFALTANNVSYAVTGDTIGYWGYYPAEGEWGKVPVWGCANVVESNCPEVPVNDRLWGFFPMASHAVLQPGRVREDQLTDMSEHRRALPALYNSYRRTLAEPEFIQAMENERCLLFPLFITSYMLYDRLLDNGFFSAKQVVIGSVSSKTGFGLAKMLRGDPDIALPVIGFTSAKNKSFVEGLGCCDQVLVYGEEDRIDPLIPTAYIDMSGDVSLTSALHWRLEDNMVDSCMVGATHWENRGEAGMLPGAPPTFFFAPGQIAKRDAEWGPGVVMMKAGQASAEVALQVQSEMTVEWVESVEALAQLWVELLDNQVAPSRGVMVTLSCA